MGPDLDATDVAVAVKDGVVTLTGFVHSYGQKRQAEKAAKRVAVGLCVLTTGGTPIVEFAWGLAPHVPATFRTGRRPVSRWTSAFAASPASRASLRG